MRLFLLLSLVLMTGCAAPKRSDDYYTASVARFIDGGFARHMTQLVSSIEHGDLHAWHEFASYARRVDGEHGETYAVACAELARRDPTFYLRRYLAGEHTAAVQCGYEAYQWSGSQGRSLLDAVYAARLYIAADPTEREQIAAFISATSRPRSSRQA